MCFYVYAYTCVSMCMCCRVSFVRMYTYVHQQPMYAYVQ